MKPRPGISSFIVTVTARSVGVSSSRAQMQMQCRSSSILCVRNAASSARVDLVNGNGNMNKRWSSAAGQGIRYASTSTSASTSSKPRRGMASPPASASVSASGQSKPTKRPVYAATKKAGSPTPTKVHATNTSSSSSSSTAPANRSASPPSPMHDKLNPPFFTYAPELSVPARKQGQNYVSYLFSCGKAYLSFYKTGISHTRQTLKYAKTVRAKVAGQGKGVSKDMAGSGILSRAEWQVLRRSKRDLLRLPVMGFLILALGEWLPVVVIYLTPVIPEACRIPRQVERVLRKKEGRRKERLERVGLHALRLQTQDRVPRTDEDAVRLAAAAEGLLSPEKKVGKEGGLPMARAIIPPGASNDLSPFHLLLLSARLDCHPRILDKLYLTPPKWLLQRNVSKTLAYLVQDDELIRRDGGVQALDKQELLRACVDRGIDVLGRSEADQRKSLNQWYKM